MARFSELRQLTHVRLVLFLREPEAVFWVFIFPVVLALVLGLAFKGRGQEASAVGIVEGTVPAEWIAALESSDAMQLLRFVDLEEAARKMRSGAVSAIVARHADGSLQVRFDPTRPEGETARLRAEDLLQRAAGRIDPVTVLREPITETGARYIDFLLPGLLGMNLMGTGMWGTGFALVDWRQKKLLKLFMATPMRRPNFLLSQVFSRMAFLVAEVGVICAFGVFALGVPLRGDLVSFSLFCVLGAMCFSGVGLLVASRATTLEGVSGLMNFVMMPMWLLSGVFFSYERYPEVLLPFIRLLPLTALNDGLRAVMLEGSSAWELRGPVLVLVVSTLLAFGVALRIFRWR